MYANRLRKIATALKKASKFNFNYPWDDSEKKFALLRGAIIKNDGLWKNPNIVYYLKTEVHETPETELERAIWKHAEPNDLGCVITRIPLNAKQFKSRFRVKEDVFIYDEHGVRMHFKVKNKYPETPYAVTSYSGETYTKKQVTKEFNTIELLWKRSPETQKKIEETPNQDEGWYEDNKKKIELILTRVSETPYNKKQLDDLRRHKRIDETQLEKLYDEAEAQGRSSFSGGGKAKTTLKIVHVGVKESTWNGGGTYNSQIIGISDDFKEKVIVKFGLGTRAGDQLAAAVGLPQKVNIHDHEDKMIGRKVTVEGEFKPYNGVLFVSRPKFTAA